MVAPRPIQRKGDDSNYEKHSNFDYDFSLLTNRTKQPFSPKRTRMKITMSKENKNVFYNSKSNTSSSLLLCANNNKITEPNLFTVVTLNCRGHKRYNIYVKQTNRCTEIFELATKTEEKKQKAIERRVWAPTMIANEMHTPLASFCLSRFLCVLTESYDFIYIFLKKKRNPSIVKTMSSKLHFCTRFCSLSHRHTPKHSHFYFSHLFRHFVMFATLTGYTKRPNKKKNMFK